MISIRLDQETENRLDALARTTHRSKSYYVREAVHSYLDEQEDILIALARIEDKPDSFMTTEEIWKRLGWAEDLK